MFSNFGVLDFSTPELLIILAIVLLIFGGKKLPELSRSLGESIKELKKATSSTKELKDEVKGQVDEVKNNLN
jgi:sec-independent protein translocase protein TatA